MKEGNSDYKYSRGIDIWDNKIEVLCSAIALDKVDLDCAETVKDKTTINDSGFITYSNTTNFSGKWLNDIGYLITQ